MWLLVIPILIVLICIVNPRGGIALTADQKFNKLEKQLGSHEPSDIGEYLARHPEIKLHPLLTTNPKGKKNG